MKLKRTEKLICTSSIIAMILFISCSRDGKNESVEFKKLLIDKIKLKINNPNRIEVRIKELTDFKWDSFVVIPPYSKLSALESDMNVNLKMIGSTGIEKRDDITVLAFIQNGEVIRFFEYPRWPGDFSKLGKTILYNQENAIFLVEETNEIASDGKQWLILTHRGE